MKNQKMKSPALNLFQNLIAPRLMLGLLLLLLVSVATAAVRESTPAITSSVTSSSSASSPTSSSSSPRAIISARNRQRALRTTTSVPPSLPKPPQLRRRIFSTTTSTNTATETTAASTKSPAIAQRQQRRLPVTRAHAASTSARAIMTSTTSPSSSSDGSTKPVIISESSTLASTRLVRHVDATTPQANQDQSQNVRQHRSFQSYGSGQSFEDVDSRRKHKAIQRRQPLRTQAPADDISPGRAIQRYRTTSANRNYNNNYNSRPSSVLTDSRQSMASTPPADELKTKKVTTAATTTTTATFPGNETDIKFAIVHNQQTPKTPRMIQRLVAGHIQNNDGRQSLSNSGKPSNYTSNHRDDSIAQGPRIPTVLSSSYRDHKLNANVRIDTTTINPATSSATLTDHGDRDYHDDDEALLDDSGDFDNWDNGILRLSAGSGKENTFKPKKGKDDSKKTLADQVRDGKYGLIEKEIFRRPPKRPGVLSYLPNKEVPEDNERNYGGLHEEDIWLAEDHLLVIKGGSLNEDNPNEPWPAIDDYNAAGRPIKIPENPKVPPPFPVQLEENGPVQLIGNNKLTVVYPVPNESSSVYAADNAASESDRDDEKNLITRPGTSKDTKENEPGYNYPSLALPWLQNNQTPADSSLKPISFPILGPFLYGRNGSLDNATDDFDEDDPSLYYPPPYSFVYKSNYTNPVAPGPLVPGIVVPPPPDQFAKLGKPEYGRRPSGGATPTRYRVYSTTTSTVAPVTSTSTTTTTTTTESPYRQGVTRISQYTPKIIHIASPTPRPVYTPTAAPAIASRLPPTPSPTPPSQHIEPVPVPVAVPIPIYPVNVEPTRRPDVLSFVPTTPESHIETFSKSNPIYYEYFEAKRQQGGSQHIIDEFLSSTVKPNPTPSPKPIKLYATSKKPYKGTQHHRNYLQPLAPNHRYEDDGVVVITPKPEVRYKPRPIFKQRPLQNFEQEVNAIRQTLRYYQNQELRDNNIPRTPKAKPVYDYNQYDAAKSVTPEVVRNTFKPPTEYDVEPFQPMVTYSPSVDDLDSFKAVPADKADEAELQPQGREEIEEPKYISTTTLVPVQPQERSKKLRVGAKYLQQPQQQQRHQYQQQHQQQQQYNSPPRWVAVNKQEFGVYTPPESPPPLRERYPEQVPVQQPQRNRDYPGYYYGPSRQNNRFYEEPFQNAPNRKIINYRPAPPPPAPLAQQQQPIWSLENDTYVNYAPNRPPLNPDAEFINPYQTIPVNTYQQQQLQQQQHQRLIYQQQQQQQQQQQGPPPALSHQSQYYAPPPQQQLPQLQQQRLPGRQYQPQPQQPVSLHRDILVNYRQPLPPINPDSEYISHPQVVRNPTPNNYYRSNGYRLPQAPLAPLPVPNLNIGGDIGPETDVYFLTPKYRRANNLQNQNSNSNNRNRQPHSNNGK